MKTNFEDSLKHVLCHEGGWADHPRDPGGATMKGITLATYRRHFGEERGKDDLRAISDEELSKIYDSGYWSKCRCDELPAGIDYVVFDAAVNSGPGRGVKWLQAAVGAKQDGGWGQKRLRKLKNMTSWTFSTICVTIAWLSCGACPIGLILERGGLVVLKKCASPL